MSWQVEIVENVRVLINDLSSSPTYTDERIERIVIIAATQVIQDVQFPTNYVIDITNSTITPDPTDADTKDIAFINLVSLKTACLISTGEARQYSLVGGVTIHDGPSTISTGNIFKNVQDNAKNVCMQYAQAKLDYKMSQSSENGQAVTTPTTNINDYCNDRGNRYNYY